VSRVQIVERSVKIDVLDRPGAVAA